MSVEQGASCVEHLHGGTDDDDAIRGAPSPQAKQVGHGQQQQQQVGAILRQEQQQMPSLPDQQAAISVEGDLAGLNLEPVETRLPAPLMVGPAPAEPVPPPPPPRHRRPNQHPGQSHAGAYGAYEPGPVVAHVHSGQAMWTSYHQGWRPGMPQPVVMGSSPMYSVHVIAPLALVQPHVLLPSMYQPETAYPAGYQGAYYPLDGQQQHHHHHHHQPPPQQQQQRLQRPHSRGSSRHGSTSTPSSIRNSAGSVSSDLGSTSLACDSSVYSVCDSHTASTSISPRGATLPEGVENRGWAWLVDGILQQVVQHLAGHGSIKAFRQTCRHWKAVADVNIRKLHPNALRPKDLVALFPRLQVLELVQCPNVRNRDLYVLALSPIQLRCLTLGDDTNRPWVTNKGLMSIGRMTNLQSLALHDCNSITNNGLSSLRGLEKLTNLSLRGCKKLTNNGLEALQCNVSLTSLNLHGCKRISDKGLNALTHLPLRALSLGLTRVKDEGMAYLAKLTQLTELHCTNEELTDEGICHLSNLTELNTLALRDCCEVSGDALQALLPSLPHLAHLNLYKNWEFGDEQLIKCCVHMLGLRSLDLRGTWVTDKGLEELTQLSNLEDLALAPHTELPSDSLAVVSKVTQLTSLTLMAPDCGPTLLSAIHSLTRLRVLNLCGDAYGEDLSKHPPLPKEFMRALSSMTQLTSLDLSRRPVTEEQLRKLLSQLTRLEVLSIHGCPLEFEEVCHLERSFPRVNIHKRTTVVDSTPELATLIGSLSIT